MKKEIRTNILIYSYKKMIQTNIRIYSYQQNDMNKYPNIFVSNKWYEYDTNEYLYRKIFECTNTFVSIFYIGVRFDVICWIFVVWYNKKHSWHNKMEVICLWILICVWTIWAIYLLDLLAHTLDFSLEYVRIKKTIRSECSPSVLQVALILL